MLIQTCGWGRSLPVLMDLMDGQPPASVRKARKKLSDPKNHWKLLVSGVNSVYSRVLGGNLRTTNDLRFYCWWFRNSAIWPVDMANFKYPIIPIIYRVSYIFGGAGFLLSTVWFLGWSHFPTFGPSDFLNLAFSFWSMLLEHHRFLGGQEICSASQSESADIWTNIGWRWM